ncbi:acyl-CoA dehydrogenase family protein [Marinobacter sp. GN3S48]|uniref:acyl-CoA dehydrogenase family protein n=1 Tax=Marinobacter sp. GN3S48 TaxID=3382302 RepID=UPI00387A8A6E
MEQTDQLILDTAYRLFSDHCGAEVVNQAELGEPPGKLHDAVMAAGLPLAWVPEKAGGVGGSLALGFNLIRQAASFAVPVPLVDTMIANLVLAESGLEVADTWAALVFDGGQLPDVDNGTVNGVVNHAPGVVSGSLLVVPVSDRGLIRVATFAFDNLAIEECESLAGESRARVTMEGASPVQLSPVVDGMTEDGLRQFCALVRASQIAGAFEKITELTVGYVKERQQFGRPLGKFQAIQHKVADIAGESALANAAVEQAIRMLSEHPEPFSGDNVAFLPVATAKVVTSEGAATVSRLAHQSHGAMGFSFEYPLQQYSRRIWSWREEYGSEFYWSERIGMSVANDIRHGGAESGQVWDIVSR